MPQNHSANGCLPVIRTPVSAGHRLLVQPSRHELWERHFPGKPERPLTEQALFVGVQGKPLNYTQLGQVFRHYVDASGVNERKRHATHAPARLASELLHAGANLRQIQELLGHKHLDSTQRYNRVRARAARRDQAAAVGRMTHQ